MTPEQYGGAKLSLSSVRILGRRFLSRFTALNIFAAMIWSPAKGNQYGRCPDDGLLWSCLLLFEDRQQVILCNKDVKCGMDIVNLD